MIQTFSHIAFEWLQGHAFQDMRHLERSTPTFTWWSSVVKLYFCTTELEGTCVPKLIFHKGNLAKYLIYSAFNYCP